MGLIAAAGAFRKYLEALLGANTEYGHGKTRLAKNEYRRERHQRWIAKRAGNPVFKLTAWQRRFWQQQGASTNEDYILRIGKLKYRKDGQYAGVLRESYKSEALRKAEAK